jgi:dihydroneopterin aldolase|tara:strand:+ start:504 stop:797 length:294 start_codon:yes stop_codon:yes gene_type:complete
VKNTKKDRDTVKYGAVSALTDHMLKGNRVSRIESLVIFGVQNFTAVLSNLKKDRFIIKKEPVTMARILRRINQYATCKVPKNLPTKNIIMHEWWVSR